MFGILSRIHHNNVLAKTTQEAAAPAVIALPPKPGAPIDMFMLPGNVTAYTDSPIYARTSGYLTKWYYDIGSHVKKGALLAEIATPELDQQLTQAQADLGTAEANAKNAHSQAQRYQDLVQIQCSFAAGYGDFYEPGIGNGVGGEVGAGQCGPAERVAIVREGLCAVSTAWLRRAPSIPDS